MYEEGYFVNDDNNILRSRQHIISKLTEARLEKQMTQAELASLIGTQRSNICRIESGSQNLSLDMLIKISDQEFICSRLWSGYRPSAIALSR